MGIAHAPDADALARWLREQEARGTRIEGAILVRGEAPVWPQDGTIEWGGNFFDTGFLMDEATGAVDYRRHAAQVAVKQGQFLARFIPPRPGTEGRDVFGKRIEVQRPKTPRIRAGANVCSDESGNEFYATKDGRVRFAEDKLLVRNLSRQILTSGGYRVLAAKDGHEALDLYETHAAKIALIVLDVVMPGLSGKAVADRIKLHNPHIPILFSSGYDFSMLESTLSSGEVANVIHKPYRQRELLRRIRELLDEAKVKQSERNDG